MNEGVADDVIREGGPIVIALLHGTSLRRVHDLDEGSAVPLAAVVREPEVLGSLTPGMVLLDKGRFTCLLLFLVLFLLSGSFSLRMRRGSSGVIADGLAGGGGGVREAMRRSVLYLLSFQNWLLLLRLLLLDIFGAFPCVRVRVRVERDPRRIFGRVVTLVLPVLGVVVAVTQVYRVLGVLGDVLDRRLGVGDAEGCLFFSLRPGEGVIFIVSAIIASTGESLEEDEPASEKKKAARAAIWQTFIVSRGIKKTKIIERVISN
jgi:hypothetical protein